MLLTGTTAIDSFVAKITLEVHLSTCTSRASHNRFVIFTVEATGVLFSTNVSDGLTKEALAFSVASVVGCPKLVIRPKCVRFVDTHALHGVQLRHVKVGQESAFSL